MGPHNFILIIQFKFWMRLLHLPPLHVSLFGQVVAWRLLQNQLPLSVDLQWALSSLCLALQQPCVWNKLSTPEYSTHTCSLIYSLRQIIVAGEEVARTCVCAFPVIFNMVKCHDYIKGTCYPKIKNTNFRSYL